jgi:hypothetical protein
MPIRNFIVRSDLGIASCKRRLRSFFPGSGRGGQLELRASEPWSQLLSIALQNECGIRFTCDSSPRVVVAKRQRSDSPSINCSLTSRRFVLLPASLFSHANLRCFISGMCIGQILACHCIHDVRTRLLETERWVIKTLLLLVLLRKKSSKILLMPYHALSPKKVGADAVVRIGALAVIIGRFVTAAFLRALGLPLSCNLVKLIFRMCK